MYKRQVHGNARTAAAVKAFIAYGPADEAAQMEEKKTDIDVEETIVDKTVVSSDDKYSNVESSRTLEPQDIRDELSMEVYSVKNSDYSLMEMCIRDRLQHKGYNFYSDTDTEVAIKLIDYYYKKYEHTPVDAINHAMVRIRGSYALAIMFRDYPEEIYAARKDSPMIIGVADGESFVASDVPAILKYTRNVYYIGNMELCRLQKGNVTVSYTHLALVQKKRVSQGLICVAKEMV